MLLHDAYMQVVWLSTGLLCCFGQCCRAADVPLHAAAVIGLLAFVFLFSVELPGLLQFRISFAQSSVLSYRIVRHFDYTVLSSGGSSDSRCLFCSFVVELVAVFSLSV